jgi:hypothetical protein
MADSAFRYPGLTEDAVPSREEFDAALKHAQTIYDFVPHDRIFSVPILLWELNPVLGKMLVLGNGFRQLEPPHYLKGKAVCQT